MISDRYVSYNYCYVSGLARFKFLEDGFRAAKQKRPLFPKLTSDQKEILYSCNQSITWPVWQYRNTSNASWLIQANQQLFSFRLLV